MTTPEERAAAVVRVAPELTGCAHPRYFWVYIGDYAIHSDAATEEEASEMAAPYRKCIAAAISAAEREAVERERRRCAVIAEIAATHTLGDPCRIIAKRIMIDPAKGE